MTEWNEGVAAGEQGEHAFPDMKEFFVAIWERERVEHSIAAYVGGQIEAWNAQAAEFNEQNAEDIENDEACEMRAVDSEDIRDWIEEGLEALWWERLIEWMRIGTDMEVGDLMVSGPGGDTVIMLATHPENGSSECWLLNGKLVSTYELIGDDVEEWYQYDG